ncbi:MAG: tetratricopeptide repeat protein, partial [Phormidesmis sp.]
MSAEDGSLKKRVDVRAEDQSRPTVIGGDVNAKTVNFGDRIETQRQILVSDIDPNRTPRKLAFWVDRTQVQAELLRRIDEPQTKLIEVVALGGFGKSSIAVWAAEPEQAKANRVVWVNFSKQPSFSSFGRWVLQEVGFLIKEETPDDELINQLVHRLAGQCCLLVMDQLETISKAADREAFEAFFARWQQQGQNSTVLLTTRERFLSSEGLCLQLSGFTPAEGAAFLQKRGITTVLPDGLSRLSGVCGGHPLLLNLSATWLKETAEQRLNEEDLIFFERLFQNDLNDSETQVGEIFELLLTALPKRLKAVFLEVSVYRMPFSLAQTQAMQPEVTEAGLATLEAQGFLLGQTDRWRLHPLVNQLVAAALRAEGLGLGAHRKAIKYFEAQLQGETRHVQDCLECFHHYCEGQDYKAAYDTVDRCYLWLDLRGFYRILAATYERLTIAWRANPPQDAEGWEKFGRALTRLGNAYNSLGNHQQAIDFLQQSLEISREIGNHNGIAASLGNLGNAYNSLGNYRQAIDFLQQSLEISREIGDRKDIASSLNNLGSTYNSLGEYHQAINFLQQSLGIAREIGDRKCKANSLGNLGLAYASLGGYHQAIDFQQQSLEIAREISDRKGEANSLSNLDIAYASLGEYHQAIDFQQQSEIAREIGDRNGTALSLFNLALAYAKIDEHWKACEGYAQAKEIFTELKLAHRVEECEKAIQARNRI